MTGLEVRVVISADPDLADVLVRAMALGKRKWRPLDSRKHFVTESDRVCGPGVQAKPHWIEVIALTSSELAEGMKQPYSSYRYQL